MEFSYHEKQHKMRKMREEEERKNQNVINDCMLNEKNYRGCLWKIIVFPFFAFIVAAVFPKLPFCVCGKLNKYLAFSYLMSFPSAFSLAHTHFVSQCVKGFCVYLGYIDEIKLMKWQMKYELISKMICWLFVLMFFGIHPFISPPSVTLHDGQRLINKSAC